MTKGHEAHPQLPHHVLVSDPALSAYCSACRLRMDDLSPEIAGKEILIPPNSPSPGVTVAFVVENGAPVESLQFDKK